MERSVISNLQISVCSSLVPAGPCWKPLVGQAMKSLSETTVPSLSSLTTSPLEILGVQV
ncbi:MAG: hypothetical protein GY842_05580 [bacterium]|nr:hypothetical protein [bacterium]